MYQLVPAGTVKHFSCRPRRLGFVWLRLRRLGFVSCRARRPGFGSCRPRRLGKGPRKLLQAQITPGGPPVGFFPGPWCILYTSKLLNERRKRGRAPAVPPPLKDEWQPVRPPAAPRWRPVHPAWRSPPPQPRPGAPVPPPQVALMVVVWWWWWVRGPALVFYATGPAPGTPRAKPRARPPQVAGGCSAAPMCVARRRPPPCGAAVPPTHLQLICVRCGGPGACRGHTPGRPALRWRPCRLQPELSRLMLPVPWGCSTELQCPRGRPPLIHRSRS